MNEKCVFLIKDGRCSILTEALCTILPAEKKCSFRKTEKEYIAEINRSIRINRIKGNCISCKYRTVKCRIRETGEDYEYYLAVSR